MDGWHRSAVVKVSVTEAGSGVPFGISGVNRPPLVSMPTECRKRWRSQIPMSALWWLAEIQDEASINAPRLLRARFRRCTPRTRAAAHARRCDAAWPPLRARIGLAPPDRPGLESESSHSHYTQIHLSAWLQQPEALAKNRADRRHCALRLWRR